MAVERELVVCTANWAAGAPLFRMYIEEVIIDGFKSYASRTVVSGFDRSFNAITGPNGSGKSNILDSICFVLGMGQLSHMRVSSLQELVYKNGQAGVTKASVSVVFNNTDKSQSPVGYEHCDKITITRQIVVGGRNKYLINGAAAQLNRVQNLFHSVQLNINNPHFLIMQGRITKVMNMKPMEILGMIEEAAGTKMFEMKKDSAIKTIEKKEKKVEEINALLAEEINPSLEKLRKERTHYMRWASVNGEQERLRRFQVAYRYHNADDVLHNFAQREEEMKADIAQMESAIVEKTEEQSKLADECKSVLATKDDKLSKEMKEQEERMAELSKAQVKLQAEVDNIKKSIAADKKKMKKLEASRTSTQKKADSTRAELAKRDEDASSFVEEAQRLKQSLRDLKRKLQAISAGIADDEEGAQSLNEKLEATRRTIGEAEASVKSLRMRISHLEKVLKEKQKKQTKADGDHSKLEGQYKKTEAEVARLKNDLSAGGYNPEEEAELTTTVRQERERLTKAKDEAARLSAQLARFDFHYADPGRGFDSAKVKGCLGKLVRISEENLSACTALEVAAGSKLYNVVVEDEKTSKDLLERGKLARRVTIIPLNKIDAKTADSGRVQEAKRVGAPGKVDLALSLVVPSDDVQAALNYVFGGVLVCDSADTAKRVTFDRSIRMKSVTLDGDLFDPAGTLTGGSRRTGNNTILALLQRLHSAEESLKELSTSIGRKQKRLAELQQAERGLGQKQKELAAKEAELSLLHDRLHEHEHQRNLDEIAKVESDLKEARASLEKSEATAAEMKKREKELEKEITSFQNSQKTLVKETEDEIARVKDALAETQKKEEGLVERKEEIAAEVEVFEKELAQMDEVMEEAERNLANLESSLRTRQGELEEVKESLAEVKKEHEAVTAKIKKADAEAAALARKRDQASKALSDLELKLDQLRLRLEKLWKEQKDAQHVLDSLEKRHPWIQTEKQYFNMENSDYDFSSQDIEQVEKRLSEVDEEIEELAKRVNKKVMGLFEKAEQEYQDLMKKKRTIEKDKIKIQRVIEELEVKKNEKLKATWEKVTEDFNNIFSTVLPGTQAKLAPPEGKTVLEGLEVKVAFGDTWKESLSELSGGQRSLLALSLILALLRFDPAPMYILDEVDAALDLSHTQNIGRMLKRHFQQSQFIVVSLKEGMFNNANVIFKTRFIDGVSGIVRTASHAN